MSIDGFRAIVASIGAHWRHRVRGSAYVEIGRGCLQHSDTSKVVTEGTELAAYRGADGVLHFRPTVEFDDGRFTKLREAEDWTGEELESAVLEAWLALPPGEAGNHAAMAACAVRRLAPYMTGLPAIAGDGKTEAIREVAV